MNPAPRTHYVVPPRTLVFVGIFLAIFGGGGAWSFLRSLRPLLWEAVPCEVVAFQPTDEGSADHPFSAKVRFRFRWEGTNREGSGLGIEGWATVFTLFPIPFLAIGGFAWSKSSGKKGKK